MNGSQPPTGTVNAVGIEIERQAILDRMGEELRLSGPAGQDAWPAILDAARSLPRRAYRSVVLTGCGDSLYAAQALRRLVETSSGLPTLALPAMEAAAYPPLLLDADALVIGISVSGKVERTIEVVSSQRERGGTAIAISAFADSDVGLAANVVIPTKLRGTPGPVPGTANFLGSMLGIAAVARELGERRNADISWAGEVGPAVATLQDLMAQGETLAHEIADRFQPPFCSLGSGQDLGIAWYGVAKFIEAAATFGVGADLEEWAHENFFTTGPGTTVFIHATTMLAAERARRVAASARKVGARPVIIGAEPASLGEGIYWDTPRVRPELAPLVTWMPMALTAWTYAKVANRSPFGIDVPDRMRTVDDDIYLAQPTRN